MTKWRKKIIAKGMQMTCGIFDCCISLCFRIMFSFCMYKYVSYKLTKESIIF